MGGTLSTFAAVDLHLKPDSFGRLLDTLRTTASEPSRHTPVDWLRVCTAEDDPDFVLVLGRLPGLAGWKKRWQRRTREKRSAG